MPQDAVLADPCATTGGLAGMFLSPAAPEISFGAGRLAMVAEEARAIAPTARAAVIVADRAMVALGPARVLAQSLQDAGLATELFGEIAGDPKEHQVETVAETARRVGAGLVIGLGGGSAIDAAKLAAAAAAASGPVSDYALAARPLPAGGAPVLAIPTTAGAGAEVTRTAVVSDADGAKLWYWGEGLMPRRALLDPLLTTSLPPSLTAWTGLDAFVHALEASTNANRSPASELFGHEALRRISRALPRAVAAPDDIEARGQMLWSASLAGLALNVASTAIAHCLSHALGSLAPVHHGLATALGQSAAIDWQVEGERLGEGQGPFARAAGACGVSLEAFPDWWRGFLASCGVSERFEPGLPAVSPDALVAAMDAPANMPMRLATARRVEPADMRLFAERLTAMLH